MSGSSNGKLVAAGLGGALVMLAIGAVIWPKAPEQGPAAPAPPPAAETPAPAVPAPAGATEAAAAADPVPTPAPATSAEWPDLPEVGEAAPSAPPPLRFPTNDRERDVFVADAVRDIGDLAVQRSLRSARWTFDANVAPVRGRVVVDADGDVAVLRIAELDTVAVMRGGRCLRRAGSLVSDCEQHEQLILETVLATRDPILLGVWLDKGAKAIRSAVRHELHGVEIGFAVPDGSEVDAIFRAQGAALHMVSLDSLPSACKAMLLQAQRNVGGLNLPSVWQFAAELRSEEPAADAPPPPPAKDAAPPVPTTTGRPRAVEVSADSAERDRAEAPKAHADICNSARLLLVDVAPITVTVPKIEPLAVESAPRIETRMAQRLRALAVDSADTVFAAIGNVTQNPTDIDRRRNILGLIVGKDGLAVAAPIVAEASAQRPIGLVEVPVVRQRLAAKPALLVAKMQEFAATVAKSHKIGEGPWIAWVLHVDSRSSAWPTTETIFEFEIPIAP